MIFRRVKAHIENENWFAVFIDFLIVVAGVFIGIQVANWNAERAVFEQETQALLTLKKEIEASISNAESKINAYQQTTAAGKRRLAFIESDDICIEDCWKRLVDFMHASQWQGLYAKNSAYLNMRNLGFPRSTAIVDAVELYLDQNINNAVTFVIMPKYRSLVRQMVEVEAQEHYWQNCWSLDNGIETYSLDCSSSVSMDEARIIVDRILRNQNVRPHLTEWIGAIVSLPDTLGNQNKAAQKAISLIDKELERR